jgi:hypothetical protein
VNSAHLNLAMAAVFLAACAGQTSSQQSSGNSSPGWCTVRRQSVDSSLAIEQARAALMGNYRVPELKPDSFAKLFDGYVVRMMAAEPAKTVGGGGVVWIDGETGCANVLLRYE